MQLYRPQLEAAVIELQALKQYNIFQPLRSHLIAVTFIFFLLLPIAAARENGIFSLVFLIPASYCTLHLITVGFRMDHPFGITPDDIPMDRLCFEIKRAAHDAYETKIVNKVDFPSEKLYNRELFHANESTRKQNSSSVSSLELFWLKVLSNTPKVSPLLLSISILWNTTVVILSYILSKNVSSNKTCRAWCTPIDLDSSILWNVGSILFTIQSFRSYDALNRYDDGAHTLGSVFTNITAMAVDIVHSFPSGRFHPSDKERLIAHLLRIPLALRDKLLNPATKKTRR